MPRSRRNALDRTKRRVRQPSAQFHRAASVTVHRRPLHAWFQQKRLPHSLVSRRENRLCLGRRLGHVRQDAPSWDLQG